MSLLDAIIRRGLPLVPRFVVRRVARPYVAGERLEQAVEVVRGLNREGALATIDYLGEAATEQARVEAAVEEYLRLLDAIQAEGLRSNISLKPTMMGLGLDDDLFLRSVTRIAGRARELDNFVRLDMEDHTMVDRTLALYRRLQGSVGNLGVVLQSMLRRTMGDVEALGGGGLNVRLVKGIYREPRAVAWRDPHTIRESFTHLLERLFSAGAYVGIATHDEHLVWAAQALIQRLGLERDRYEFQMLLGVEPELRRILLGEGHRLRVYVPYGQDWYAYSARRLRENPSVAWHVLRALFSGNRG